jgi:hypothetical protein
LRFATIPLATAAGRLLRGSSERFRSRGKNEDGGNPRHCDAPFSLLSRLSVRRRRPAPDRRAFASVEQRNPAMATRGCPQARAALHRMRQLWQVAG